MVDLRDQFDLLHSKYIETLNTLDYVEKKVKELEEKKEKLEQRQRDVGEARAVVQEIAFQTQKNLEFHVSSLVTTAVKHVDPTWPDYEVEFVKRRNKTECDILFCENGKRQHPLGGAGGGSCDVSSFAQLISYWTLRKNRPFFFLDEPFRNVSPDLQHRVSEMLTMVCDKIKIQILMISHADDINLAADKTFVVTKEDGLSRVREEVV